MAEIKIPNIWRERESDPPTKDPQVKNYIQFLVCKLTENGDIATVEVNFKVDKDVRGKEYIDNGNWWTHWMPIPKADERDPYVIMDILKTIIYSFDNILDAPRRKKVWKSIRLMKALTKKIGVNYRKAFMEITNDGKIPTDII